jgi:hypothetical protein
MPGLNGRSPGFAFIADRITGAVSVMDWRMRRKGAACNLRSAISD